MSWLAGPLHSIRSRQLILFSLDDFTIGNAATIEGKNAMSFRAMAKVAIISLGIWHFRQIVELRSNRFDFGLLPQPVRDGDFDRVP